MTGQLISGDEFAALGLDDWRAMYGAIEARFRTGDFATGLDFVARIGAAAQAADHHPDITLTYPAVHVLLTSHDAGGTTQRDVDLARHISAIAAELGIDAEPGSLQRIELALDTWDLGAVKPFWSAVLGMRETGADEIRDTDAVIPAIWFQEAEPTTAQRWHVDIRVPPEQAAARIAAAVAAGGAVVDETAAPSFTVLADPQGNKVCVCTHLERSH